MNSEYREKYRQFPKNRKNNPQSDGNDGVRKKRKTDKYAVLVYIQIGFVGITVFDKKHRRFPGYFFQTAPPFASRYSLISYHSRENNVNARPSERRYSASERKSMTSKPQTNQILAHGAEPPSS
jgi:hypothetical protein